MGRPQLPHGSDTYVLCGAERFEAVKRQAEAEVRLLVAAKIETARAQLALEIRNAYAEGASVSKLCEAYGSNDLQPAGPTPPPLSLK